jgi:formate-nitrite transporter family protein
VDQLTSTPQAEPLRPDDHVIGPDSAPVTLIAYCDFECPHCGDAFGRIKTLRMRFPHQLRFVFRHFPLVEKHPFAQQAAEASEAAAQQGQFWVMHDLLFEHQEDLEPEDLYRYAESAGLDVSSFKAQLHDRVHAARVLYDVRSGRRNGVSGTPTFFLNDAWLEDDDRLEALIGRAA